MKIKIDFLIPACAAVLALGACGGEVGSSPETGGDYGVCFKAQSDDRYGMISSGGEILFDDEFDMPPKPAVGGVFSVMGSDFKTRYYTATPKPETIGKDAYVAGGYCTEGVIPVVKEGQPVVLIDKTGKEVASLAKADGKRVTMVNGYFSDGLLLFSAERKFGYFNPRGEVAIKAAYDDAYPFSEGLAVVAKSKPDGSKSWSAIDKSGKEVARLNISHDDMSAIPMYFDGALVCGADVYGKDGKRLFRTPSGWTEMTAYNDGYASFREGGKWGVCDKQGNEVIRAKYDNPVKRIDGGFLAIDGTVGDCDISFVDANGDEIKRIDGAYSCRMLSGSRIVVWDAEDDCYLVDANGEELDGGSYAEIGVEPMYYFNGQLMPHSTYGAVPWVIASIQAGDAHAVGEASAQPQSQAIDYEAIIAAYYGGAFPADIDIEEMVEMFNRCCSGSNPLYENSPEGFKSFAVDYLETDIFSGADEYE